MTEFALVPAALRALAGIGDNEFRTGQPCGMGAVTRYLTAIPVARVWRDIGRKAIIGENNHGC